MNHILFQFFSYSDWTGYILAFSTSLLLSTILTPFVIRLGIVDHPKDSRWHSHPVALLGGIAIFVSFLISILVNIELSCLTDNNSKNITVLICSFLIFLVGLADDLKTMSVKVKFGFQIFIASISVAFGIKSNIFSMSWINFLFTLIWIIGIVNAVNLLDNMDGLAAGISSIAAIFVFVISMQKGESLTPVLAAALLGGCIGFLFFNFNPAKIFMGDCGSMFLGFILAVLVIDSKSHSSGAMFNNLLVPFLILGVPIFDTCLVIFLRVTNGRMPWKGGKDHSSHRLASLLNGKERIAVLILYVIGILSGLSALIILQRDLFFALIAASVLGTGIMFFAVLLSIVPYSYNNQSVK
jgi:UDP-GlcNAc:undecaprenyl-phosphate GlcNAc-1-phosphate transferase